MMQSKNFELSLAGWSLASLFRAKENPLSNYDFPKFTRDTFGLRAVELNNIFFDSTRPADLDRLRKSADDADVKLLNIAIDEHGDLSNANRAAREIAIANYARWIPVAAYLGITAVRANSGGKQENDESAVECCIDSFRRLADVGQKFGVQILIENHWGLSYSPDFIVRLIKAVRLTHGDVAVGALADFGNWPDSVDRYAALRQIMSFAFATHAKVNQIDENLNHPRFDHRQCLTIARDAGYRGYLGIEYENSDLEPIEGIRRGVRLLQQLM